jgi:PKD repeat protein
MKYLYSLFFTFSVLGLFSQGKKADFTMSSTSINNVVKFNSNPVNLLINKEECLTQTVNNRLLDNNTYRLKRQSAINLTKQKVNDAIVNRAAPPVYTIPVVFHVIHEGEAVGTLTNISDAQVISAIDALNRDFRRTSADGGISQGAGPDTEIQFCLASTDPSGNPHSGINRVDGSSVINYNTQGIIDGGSGNESQVKNLSKWDNRYYLNVWVVSEINDEGSDIANVNSFGGGTIGYAYYPVNPVTANTNDGIVVIHCAVGNDPSGSQGYRLWSGGKVNKTLTHEVGHYLNLAHTFENTPSCSEIDCNLDGDGLCDTPPTVIGNGCSTQLCTGAIVENYMDYTSETCKDMYTTDQTAVMRGVLAGVRNNLVTTSNCDPVVVSAGFSANITTVTTGGSVTFTDQSTGGVMTSWTWNFGGGGLPNTSSVQNPTVTFSATGTYTVSLIASDGITNDTETKTSYIVVSNYDPLICDTLTNINPTDGLTAFPVGWGAYPGHNSIGIDGYAEPFNVTAATEVQKVILPIFQADNGTVGSTIDVVVYNDNFGEPGTVLGSQTRLITDLNAGFYNIIAFNTPVSVNGDFWVGIEVNYGLGDTVIFGTADDRSPSSDSTTLFRAGGNWYQTNSLFAGGMATSLYLDILTSGSPGVSFTETTLTINQGGTVTFDASTSTSYSDLLWEFDNALPNTSTNVSEVVTYNTLGTHDVTLYLLGGCRVDSLVKQVTVSVTTGITENDLNTSVSIFPNPTNDILTVVFDEKVKGVANIELLDANGRLVATKSIQEAKSFTQVIDVNSLAKGIYQLRINNNSLIVNKKVVIN